MVLNIKRLHFCNLFLFIILKIINNNNGEIMKKIYFVLTVLIIFFLFNNKDEIITVFNTNDYYEIYYLDFNYERRPVAPKSS